MYLQATQYASQQIFSAASGIVENVASEVITSTYIEHPKLDHIMRGVNRKRQRLRLEDPQTIYFEVIKLLISYSFNLWESGFQKLNKFKHWLQLNGILFSI